jgi:hypothetical protein
MNFQQVCLTALAFSSSHGGSLERAPPGQQQFVSIRPLQGPPSELVVERDLVEDGAWGVRLMRRHHRLLQAPIHYPPVRTQEALLDALVGAWSQLASNKPPALFLTRFLEPPSPPAIQRTASIASFLQPARTPPGSASPPRRQRGVSPQTPLYHE